MEKAQKAGAPITEAEASQKAQERFKEEARRLTRTGFKYGWSGGNPVEDLKITDNWTKIIADSIQSGEDIRVLDPNKQDKWPWQDATNNANLNPEMASQLNAAITTSGMVGAKGTDAFNKSLNTFLKQSGADAYAQREYLNALQTYGVTYKDKKTGATITETEYRKMQQEGRGSDAIITEGAGYTALRNKAGVAQGQTSDDFEKALNAARVATVAQTARSGDAAGNKIVTKDGQILDNTWWNRHIRTGGEYRESTGNFKFNNDLESFAVNTDKVAKAMEGLAKALEPLMKDLQDKQANAANSAKNNFVPPHAFGGFLPASIQSLVGERGPELFVPGRAFGGSTKKGSAYLVGENGPELFRPNQDGTIITNNITQDLINKSYGMVICVYSILCQGKCTVV